MTQSTLSSYAHPNSQVKREDPFSLERATGNAREATFSPYMSGKLWGVKLVVTALGTSTGTGTVNIFFNVRNGSTSIGQFLVGASTVGHTTTIEFNGGTAFTGGTAVGPDFNILRGSDLDVEASGRWIWSADHNATVLS